MAKAFTLILGGVRSGKSDLAQKLAQHAGGQVLFLATAEPGDAEMQTRIAAHRAQRPAGWRTVEAPLQLADTLDRHAAGVDVVLLDCVTLWVSNIMAAVTPVGAESPSMAAAEGALAQELGALHDWHRGTSASIIAVSNEVGMGLVPPYPSGRLYRDLLGMANQRLATLATQVYVTFAGIPVDVKALSARLWEHAP
ncbi:MAG: bifunctional adenosylcobinamide kinase/adenosylcobinamide-phosphate guanylyltransferase [Dehalococcoidia bacterium]|nr:bifunctional adenosylcobinamide kinase/adenosylcobinamide-phosphate guanylyltransferase [Dehalococcoidia bacterium]